MGCRPLFQRLLVAAGVGICAPVFAGDADLDPGFGPNGDGRLAIGLDAVGDMATQIVPALDGSLYVVGVASPGIGIVRLTADGLPHPDFSPVKHPVSDDEFAAGALAAVRSSGGALLVGGYYFTTLPADGPFWLACRFDANGAPDASFGDGNVAPGCASEFPAGTRRRGAVRDLAVQVGGRVVLAGYIVDEGNTERAAMARVQAQGSLDLAFGEEANGFMVPLDNVGPASGFNALKLGPFGELLATGDYVSSGTNSEVLVTRHTPDGAPREGFGTNGVALHAIAIGPVNGRRDRGAALTLTSGGLIAVAGSAQHAAGSDNTAGFVLWLNAATGGVVADMGLNGRRILPIDGTRIRLNDILQTPQGRLVVGGTLGSGQIDTPDVALLAAFDGDGDYDTTFGGQGITAFEFVDSAEMGAVQRSEILDIAVQDDKILVAGAAIDPALNSVEFGVARIGDERLFSDEFESDGP